MKDFLTGFEKRSKELTSKSRNSLPDDAFVFPKERKFPIHDRAHARNALARAHFASDPGRVRSAVHAKYPDIGEEKAAGVAKGLMSGLLGVSDITAETVARQAGKGVRRSVGPVAAAGGTAALLKSKEHDKKEEAEKKAEVSKEDLKRTLKKHEERETPAQEAAESAEEQKIERAAGVEKNAFWAGFEKKADLHQHFIHTHDLTDEEHQKLMDHVHKVREFREKAIRHVSSSGKGGSVELGGSPNWRDDALHGFLKEHPHLKEKVWAGGGMTIGTKKDKPGLLSRMMGRGPEKVPNGQGVIVTRLEKKTPTSSVVAKGFGKLPKSFANLKTVQNMHWSDLSSPEVKK